MEQSSEVHEVQYRSLALHDLDATLLANFNRYQETNRVWVRTREGFIVRPDHFIEDWDEREKRRVLRSLRQCAESGGTVSGAFMDNRLVGLASVEPVPFGSHGQYRELSHMHVSLEFRNSGIGKKLLELSCVAARRLGATKLYIGAHPDENTQEFYRSLGCTFAEEINQNIYERESLDIQLECAL